MDILTPLIQKENSKSTWTGRQIRDPKKESDFLANVNSDALQEVCLRAMALVDDNVGQALELCTSSLLRASERILKKKKNTHKKKKKHTFLLESVSKILCGSVMTVECQTMMLSPC